MILATLRDKGNCPCPRCLIPKLNFHRLGFLTDLGTDILMGQDWQGKASYLPAGHAVERSGSGTSLKGWVTLTDCGVLFLHCRSRPVAQLVVSLELLFWVPWTIWFQHIPCAHGRPTTRVWTWSGQVSPQTPDMPHSCNRSQPCEYPEWTVSVICERCTL